VPAFSDVHCIVLLKNWTSHESLFLIDEDAKVENN
jgi:hypothetical protein